MSNLIYACPYQIVHILALLLITDNSPHNLSTRTHPFEFHQTLPNPHPNEIPKRAINLVQIMTVRASVGTRAARVAQSTQQRPLWHLHPQSALGKMSEQRYLSVSAARLSSRRCTASELGEKNKRRARLVNWLRFRAAAERVRCGAFFPLTLWGKKKKKFCGISGSCVGFGVRLWATAIGVVCSCRKGSGNFVFGDATWWESNRYLFASGNLIVF